VTPLDPVTFVGVAASW